MHNILKLNKDDICIKKKIKSKLWVIGVEQLFFPHSWLSMVQDDLMCNAYSQSMWSSAKIPVVFLLKFGWWEVNCCRKVNTQGFTQSIVSWPAFRNNFVVYPLHFFSTEKITDNNMACVYDIPSCIHNFKRKDKNFNVSLWTVFLYPPLAPLLKRRTLEYFFVSGGKEFDTNRLPSRYVYSVLCNQVSWKISLFFVPVS